MFKKIKLLVLYYKQNWISLILNLILYILPVLLVIPYIYKIFSKNLLVFIVILTLIFLIAEILKSKELQNNADELKQLRIENRNYENAGLYLESLPKEFLKSVSQFLNLKNSDRISLYVLEDKKFKIIGRYSENPVYIKIGRSEYPSDRGYIAMCLKDDSGKEYFYKHHLPKDSVKYAKIVSEETNMSEEEINNLTMKSRSYFTRIIKNRQNNNVGILVIESVRSNFTMKVDVINNKLLELSIPHMATLLDVGKKLKRGNSNE